MKLGFSTMKPFAAFACCCAAFILQPAPQAIAAPLLPGTTILAAPEPDPIGGTTVFSTNVLWGTPGLFSGTLTSTVLSGDASNHFGPGALTFTYDLTLDLGSTHVASGLTVGGYGLFLTDASFQPGPGVAPILVGRDPSGQDAQFDFKPFLTGSYILPGQYSAHLVVQTDATSWSGSAATVIDSVGYGPFYTLAPTDVLNPVPEPTTAALGLLGVLSTLCFRRKKQ